MDTTPLTWDDLLELAWERDRRIAARVCDPADDFVGFLAALWERRAWNHFGGVDVWWEPHPQEAAAVNAGRDHRDSGRMK